MNILFFVDTFFPYGEAFSSRAQNLYRLLSLNNNNVHIIASRTQDNRFLGGSVCYEGEISFQIIPFKKSKNRIERFVNIFCRKALFFNFIDSYLKSNHVDLIVTSSAPSFFSLLFVLEKKFKIKGIVEQCEWFDKSNYRLKSFSFSYIRLNCLRRMLYPKADGVIAISRLLQNYYYDKTKTIRIPTILDVNNIDYSLIDVEDKIQLFFSGSLGGSKENITTIIGALAHDKTLRKRYCLTFLGPDREQIVKSIQDENLLDMAGDSVVIKGRVEQADVNDYLRSAHYLFFMRPHRRSSDAGFPTKLGESMSVGTPVITNDTGDIGLYLKDGYNGFIINDESEKGISDLLRRVAKVSKTDYRTMREAARKTAEESFDYRNYKGMMDNFIEEILRK